MNKTLYNNVKKALKEFYNVENTGDNLSELSQVLYELSEEIGRENN